MSDLVGLIFVLAIIGTVLGGLPLLAARVRRRGLRGISMGPFDEIWDPAAYRDRIEFQVQEERRVPSPSPEDKPW